MNEDFENAVDEIFMEVWSGEMSREDADRAYERLYNKYYTNNNQTYVEVKEKEYQDYYGKY